MIERHDISSADHSFPAPRKYPKVLPFCLLLWSHHQLWHPDLVTQADHPNASNSGLCLQDSCSRKSILCSLGKEIHTYWPPTVQLALHSYNSPYMSVPFLLLASFYMWENSLLENLPTQLISKYLSWDLSQVCQTPGFMLFPTSHKLEHALLFLTCFGLAKKIFSSVINGWRKEK